MDTIDRVASLLSSVEQACADRPAEAWRIATSAIHEVLELPRSTEQAERVIRLAILRLHVLARPVTHWAPPRIRE